MSVFLKELVENSRVVHVFFTIVVVAVLLVLVGVMFNLVRCLYIVVVLLQAVRRYCGLMARWDADLYGLYFIFFLCHISTFLLK